MDGVLSIGTVEAYPDEPLRVVVDRMQEKAFF
jgi:hypothetical protein